MADISLDAIILCGGLGERLRSVISDRPKVLAGMGGGNKVFMDIVLETILQYGFKNIILSTGHLKEQIRNRYMHYHHNACNITFSEEDMPLGTGGALKNAERLVKSSPFLVMNGDSICNVNLTEFIEFHVNRDSFLSMVLVRSDEPEDYGNVEIDDLTRITGFKEKCPTRKPSLINAGIYLMQRNVFSDMPEKTGFSLERDFFPNILDRGCYGFVTESELIDIGTPDRYRNAVWRYNHQNI